MDSNTSLQGGEDNDFPTGFLITTANDCLNLFLLLLRLIRSSSSFWCCRCTFSWSWSYGSYWLKCLPALTVGEPSLDKWKSLCLTQVGGNTFYSMSAGSSGNHTSSEDGIDKTSQVPQQESSYIRNLLLKGSSSHPYVPCPEPNSQIGYGIAAQQSHAIPFTAAISFHSIVYLAFILE